MDISAKRFIRSQEDSLNSIALVLLQAIGVTGPWRIAPLLGGGNNRLYRLDTDAETYVMKVYFQHSSDPRNRLRAEYDFCKFAWQAGLRALPQPLAESTVHNAALYSFVVGDKLQSQQMCGEVVSQAMNFLLQLNQHRTTPAARLLGSGSEACFTLDEHIAAVDRRVTGLKFIQTDTIVDIEAIDMITNDLIPRWEVLKRNLLQDFQRLNRPTNQPIAVDGMVLSPSDFGFHNALRRRDASIIFLDFEYAGWDDAAKVFGDFFNQVAVPVPLELFDEALNTVATALAFTDETVWRCRALLPLYTLKWATIVLNIFRPVDSLRRRFARGDDNELVLKQRQIILAEQVIRKLDILLGRR